MKTILCYGDSNTWGAIPGEDGRYDFSQRWPGILQSLVGSSVRIIEEGLRGRSASLEDPLRSGRNGLATLPMILESHDPLDLVILMLGTNDLKVRYNLTPFCVAQGVAKLVEACQQYRPKISHTLLVTPAHVVLTKDLEKARAYEGAIEKSKGLAEYYAHFAQKLKCNYFDAATLVESDSADGVHINQNSHQKLALALNEEIKKIWGPG